MAKKEPLSRKLTFGIFYLLSSSVVAVLLNVALVGFVARSLGVENFGLYSTIISFVGLFQFLSDFGLNRTLLKFGSTNITNAQFSFGNALFLKTLFRFSDSLSLSSSNILYMVGKRANRTWLGNKFATFVNFIAALKIPTEYKLEKNESNTVPIFA